MLGEQASVSENGTVKTPRRPREYLTEGEIDRLMTIARQSDRYGHRDATAILVAFRHGLRSSELVALEWDQIDLTRKTIRLWRVKGVTLPPTTLPTQSFGHLGGSSAKTPQDPTCSFRSVVDRSLPVGFAR